MFDIQLWPPTAKKRGESQKQLDPDKEIAQFLATATIDKGKTPQRWSTIPRSQAHGATYRVSHNRPPQQALPVNQVANLPIHRPTEFPRSTSTSLPSPSPQAPIRRVPVPPRITQYVSEVPGDIIRRDLRETNHSSVREFSGDDHHLHGVQPPNNPSEVEKPESPTGPVEFSIEGHTFQHRFSSHDFVAKPHIEVEGDCPPIAEFVPVRTTAQSPDPAISYQSNPIELSADAPPASEPRSRADNSLSPEAGSGLDASSSASRAETIFPEESDNMNPPSTALFWDNQYPRIPQDHNPRVPVLQTQFEYDISGQLVHPAQAEQSVQKSKDQQPLAAPQTGQHAGNYSNSAPPRKFMSSAVRADGPRDPTFQAAAPHHYNHQSVLSKIHDQPALLNNNPGNNGKSTLLPLPESHRIVNLPIHESRQPLTGSMETRAIPALREENARQPNLQVMEGNEPLSSLGHAYHEPGWAVDQSSVNDTPATQRSSETRFSFSPGVEPAITEARTAAPNTPQQTVNLPGSGHPNPDDAQHQAFRSLPHSETPKTRPSKTATPDTGEQGNSESSKSTQASRPRHDRNLLEKQPRVSNHSSKENPEGSKNRGLGVMKRLAGLVGGSGSTMPVSYSPEEVTRRCLDFMEQQEIPSNPGIDPFSSILMYTLEKWRGDEARIHEQRIEIKNLVGSKERYRSQLESTREKLQRMTQHRDQLKRDLIGTESKLKAIEKDLRTCQGSLTKQEQKNKDLEKWAADVEATNEEVFKEGEWRIHELKETISRTVREKDREFRDMKATLQKDITRLQKRIASYGTEGFRFVSDDKFQSKMQAAAQTINNLVSYIARPAPDSLDANLDATLFLRRNGTYLGNRIWPKFIFGICWGVLKRGFFSAPLGFGILGEEGDGYNALNHFRETLAVYDPTTEMLGIPNNKQTNEVRGFLFERLWADVAAIATTQSAHSVTDEKGAKGLPIYFHKNIDTVASELVSVLARCSASNLSPLALGLIQELVRDVGFLALEMATQRAHVTLEFCMHGDVIQQGKYFKDETSLDDRIGTAQVDLMIEPALTRLGNGKDELTEQEVLRRGSFVALRG